MSSGDRAAEILEHASEPIDWQRWRWRGLILYGGDDGTVKLLKRIDADRTRLARGCDERARVCWLLKFRSDLQSAINYTNQFGNIAAIKFYLGRCPVEMIPVCVWLWGRCADRFRLYGLPVYRHSPSPKVRRHVAKALRRVEAWALVNEMAAAYPDDVKIQWYANAPTTHRTFAKRLKSYASTVDDSHADEVHTPSQMPFWALDQPWELTPPKSVDFIRRILRRIQHWVHWGVSQ